MSRGTKRELCEKISPAKTQRQQRKKRRNLFIECNINYQLSIINYQLKKKFSRKDAKAAKKKRVLRENVAGDEEEDSAGESGKGDGEEPCPDNFGTDAPAHCGETL